ncbi:MAG: hypothetical protein CMJ18_04550 [Phycisphaeraceae bacterium]|nr:hypothetical protein [Phycisphaeraceae bacterium]
MLVGDTPGYVRVQTDASSATEPSAGKAILRAIGLFIGAAGAGLLAHWIWLISRVDGQFVLAQGEWIVGHLPTAWVGAALAMVVVGGLSAATSLWRDPRLRSAIGWCVAWMGAHRGLTVVLGIVVAAGSIDIYELVYDPFEMKRGVRPWMVRQDLHGWLLLAASLMAGLGISALWPDAGRTGAALRALRRRLTAAPRRWLAFAIVVPVVLAAVMCRFALEGIAHFSDALTYLIQGRMLMAGDMVMPTPDHEDLFRHSMFFVAVDGRFFGKYPLGWPLIVGIFDHLRVGYLANATLVGFGAFLTHRLARQLTSRRAALIAALLVGLSPWLWFTGANFSSHAASMCALTGFIWLFLDALRTERYRSALGAGLFLGAGVLIRPADAAMYAFVPILVVLAQLVRRPKSWIALGPLIAAAALIGVTVYFWQNATTTGSALTSPYTLESRWDRDWDRSPLETAGRALFQWVEMNRHFPGWGIGGLTVALVGALAAARWRHPGLRLLVACNVVFMLGNSLFGFTTVWWGPRWLAPLMPLCAILGAELVDRMWGGAVAPATTSAKDGAAARGSFGAAATGQLGMAVLFGGLLVGLLVVFTGQFQRHLSMPPHLVSGDAHRTAQQMGLADAVVAMPTIGARPPLDARAGMVFMDAPFESNPIIYVRAIPNWAQHARSTWPDRKLYLLIHPPDDPGNYRITAWEAGPGAEAP